MISIYIRRAEQELLAHCPASLSPLLEFSNLNICHLAFLEFSHRIMYSDCSSTQASEQFPGDDSTLDQMSWAMDFEKYFSEGSSRDLHSQWQPNVNLEDSLPVSHTVFSPRDHTTDGSFQTGYLNASVQH